MNDKGQVLVDFLFQNPFRKSFSLKKNKFSPFFRKIFLYNTVHRDLFVMSVTDLTLNLAGILQSKQHITF